MEEKKLKKLLDGISRGRLTVSEGLRLLKSWPAEDLGYAVIDHHRALRKGFPEVIFCAGKSAEDILGIFSRMAGKSSKVLATRVSPEVAEELVRGHPRARHNPRAGTVSLSLGPARAVGRVVILAAGTSDLPVAEEARETAGIMGSRVQTVYDVGVAGLHRLLVRDKKIRAARVLVVTAGMDGALASVVGGLYPMPVIAVPTSVGYGAAFGGLAPLLAMLNSCAPGVGVVNIDNGFGAGYLAHLINTAGKRGA